AAVSHLLQVLMCCVFRHVLLHILVVKDGYLTNQSNQTSQNKKTELIWKVNETNNIAKCGLNNDPVVFDKYEGRAELFRQNYSLLLKNVQHNDSGDYTAFMVSGEDQKVAEYKVIVQDAVSPVNLTVDSVSGSSDSCSLTVNCSTVDSQISSIFTCDAQNCSQVEENNFIICNHSNKVSWTDSKTKHYCDTRTGNCWWPLWFHFHHCHHLHCRKTIVATLSTLKSNIICKYALNGAIVAQELGARLVIGRLPVRAPVSVVVSLGKTLHQRQCSAALPLPVCPRVAVATM
uniref:Uncharacterized LOC101483209 n=1 Tax=Maylandia zebra TaxID=106582 RepID=A0A3P9DCH5_9CICH